MKKTVFSAALALLLSACVGEAAKDVGGEEKVPVVAVAGNSIADFWINYDSTFFATEGYIDFAVSGETSRQVLRRFPNSVLKARPDVVVIVSPHTNDVAANEGPVTDEQMIANLDSMIMLSRAAGAIPVVTANLPSNYFFWRTEMRPGEDIIRVNGKIKAMADSLGVAYVDLHTPLAAAGGAFAEKYTLDGAHPNSAGYAVMGPLVKAAVDSVLSVR